METIHDSKSEATQGTPTGAPNAGRAVPARQSEAETKARILIVDDHPVLRRGLASLIESEPGFAVCGEAATCPAALEAIRERRPDLVIVDLTLEGCDGLDLVKDMKKRHPKIPALVLSMHDESVYAERALRAGARGYVTKQELDDTVLAAIRRLLAGGTYMSAKLEARFAQKYLGGRTLVTGRARGTPTEGTERQTTRGGSQGPTLFAFHPLRDRDPAPHLDAIPILYYRVRFPDCAGPNVGDPDSCDYPGYTMCDIWTGAAFVESQRTNTGISIPFGHLTTARSHSSPGGTRIWTSMS